jgi:NodT family efflux transporter outer membrane factor (OMF) lipoprotein
MAAMAATALACFGCTSPREYLRNGFKVGPDYCRPAAPVAEHWIDADDVRTREGEDLSRWWEVFHDPALNRLVATAYRQNLSLREAGCRVLEARALVGVARSSLFPQEQDAFGGFERGADSLKTAGRSATSVQFFDQWNTGFSLAWELDFWGRFRRAVAAADAHLDASVEDYDDVLVTLLGDVAANYVQVRTLQERIRLLRRNVELQKWVRDLLQQWLDKGFRATQLDVAQAVSNLEQTEAAIPELEIDLRQAANRLCVLLGVPPADLHQMLGEGPIPAASPELAIGIPAELLRRRPDVRRAERQAAAQAEMIGIAQAELYPALSITGTLGYQAKNFNDLFSGDALSANVGPSFRWNILNYGRIVNNVRFQDARFQELVVVYQNTVLRANEEAENGLVTFLRAQQREGHLAKSAEAATVAVETILSQYRAGKAEADFNRYALIEQNRVQQQDLLAQSRGEIAQGLIQVYRALGGGWETRLGGGPAMPADTEPPGRPTGAEKALPPPGTREPVPLPHELPTLPKPDSEKPGQ